MSSQVFYRKWRPHTLADLVGQEPITRTLLNAIISGRLAHAYLFFGPRGTGKTSTGRILARAINCLQNQAGEPCNDCAMCRSFLESRALDLIEIDAASNNGVDDIRNLKEKTNFAPNIARYKVYIIDEVHMLSPPAFNALLKTLEEPPPHVVFILATTEVHKVPGTIISRCQRFDFRRIPLAAMIDRLARICREEGISADHKALALIARSATGSLRDAENLLERLVVYHGPCIELEPVRAELGLTGDARIKELAVSILSKDVSAGLATINSVAADGLDLRHFSRELVEYLRQMLLIKAGAEQSTGLTLDEIAQIKTTAERASLPEISQAIRAFAQADFRFSPQSTLPLELALVDCALSGTGAAVAETRKKTPAPEKEVAPAPVAPVSRKVETGSPVVKEPRPAPPLQGPPDIEYIKQHWDDFLNACKGDGTSRNLFALLRQECQPVALEGNTLTLGFYHEFGRSKMHDPKYTQIVERKLKDVFSTQYRISAVLLGEGSRPAAPSLRESPLVKEALSRGARIISEE